MSCHSKRMEAVGDEFNVEEVVCINVYLPKPLPLKMRPKYSAIVIILMSYALSNQVCGWAVGLDYFPYHVSDPMSLHDYGWFIPSRHRDLSHRNIWI